MQAIGAGIDVCKDAVKSVGEIAENESSEDAIKVLDNAVKSATELAKEAINAYHVHKGTVSREDLELPGDELMGDDNWDGDKPKGVVDEAEVKPAR